MIIHNDPYSIVHCGDCLDPAFAREVMGELRADALIFDAPFSDRTHQGHDGGIPDPKRSGPRFAAKLPNSAIGRYAPNAKRQKISYEPFDANKIAAFCNAWLPLCNGWIVSITDHELAPLWKAEFERAGLYAFAPLPLVELGGRVRLTGDGPSSWTCWIIVARPRREPFSKWGTLPGAYVQSFERKLVVGGKPFRSMCAIVSDYSRRGDLVLDPFAGGGVTLRAAKYLGRRSIGIELDRARALMSARAVSKTHEQMSLFEASPIEPMRQLSLLGEP